jgi:carboxyl-terminal processing protease
MKTPRLRPLLTSAALLAFVLAWALPPIARAAAVVPSAPRQMETPQDMRDEIKNLVQILRQFHYNREAVTIPSYGQLLPDFMASLDGQRLFFLESDKKEFLTKHNADNLYFTVGNLGSITAAYEIFAVYERRVQERAAWIAEELKKEPDLSGRDTYAPDRSKADWPADAAAADDLWRRRIKFDFIQELLATPKPATPAVPADAKAPQDKVSPPSLAPPALSPSDKTGALSTLTKPPAATKTLAEAKAAIAKRYERLPKNVADIDANDLAEAFLTCIAQLYDPHSSYFSASTYEDFGIQMRLQLVGIGALLSLEDDYCVVKELVPGGPADLGKQLKPNDRIVAIAQDKGEPVEVIGMKLRKIVQMIRGGKGTSVRLVVESGEGTATARRNVVIARDVVNLDSARAHAAVFTVPAPGGQGTLPLGVITLPAFYGPDSSTEGDDPATASRDVAELIRRLDREQHIRGLVLDLRRNGGGLLGEAVNLAGLFLDGGGPVVQVKSHEGDVKVDAAKPAPPLWAGPLVVLVDRFSASASEIVAGALQNYGRAIVIGDTSTHGKGTVQTVFEMSRLRSSTAATLAALLGQTLPKTGATKLTIQKFYLPNGASTQLRGVIPDIILPSVDEFLPIGESSLPHALGWDEIKPSKFAGGPLAPATLAALRAASDARQQKLPEFSYLRDAIGWFKTKQDEKALSLNLAAREKQKIADADRKKAADAELKKLEAAAYAFTETMLAPPPPPRIKAPAADDASDDSDEAHSGERYAKMDINLRESLRILGDALALAPQPPQWQPLAARATASATSSIPANTP